MLATARAGPQQRPEPGAPAESPVQVTRTQALEPSCADLRHSSRELNGSRAAGTPASALVSDVKLLSTS